MRLSQIAQVVGGELLGDDADVAVATSIDSRQVVPGGLFAALRGERADGHRFVAQALGDGAAAALISSPGAVDGARPVIVVDDVEHALGSLAAHHVAEHRDHMAVIAITGSMGKTSTKDLLAAALPGVTVATQRSYNNEIGMPHTALRVTDETEYLVLEMGADKEGDLAYLTDLVAPDIAVVLAVGRAHLGVFGSIEAVARAKSELVDGLRAGGTAVLNAADPRVRAMAEHAESVLYFGDGGQVRAEGVEIGIDLRARFTLVTPAGSAPVRLGLQGAHHVSNALAAAAAMHAAGLDTATIAAGLTDTSPASPHRMNVVERPDGITVIDDSYNANPDSMAAGLRALAHIGADRRTVAVLGAMLELGEATQAEHRAVGALALDLGVDRVHLLGDIAASCAVDGLDARLHEDLEDVRAALTAELRPGDVVLFKSSNGTRLYELAEEWTA